MRLGVLAVRSSPIRQASPYCPAAVLPKLAASAAQGAPADNKPGVVQAADHAGANHAQVR